LLDQAEDAIAQGRSYKACTARGRCRRFTPERLSR
jgi:hypothetical protein